MTLQQRVEWRYDSDGRKFPVLTVTVEGVHDVGRLAATLARGNCEHSSLARDIGRDLNRTQEGRSTLAYLEGHGGPKLRPLPCEECAGGNHAACHQRLYPHDAYDGSVCGCFEAEGDYGHAQLEIASVEARADAPERMDGPPVVDLMAALEKSVAAAREARGRHPAVEELPPPTNACGRARRGETHGPHDWECFGDEGVGSDTQRCHGWEPT